ncbi:uncharacterized protein LOC129577678 [Sitodiplosis mosellana]|uniref:uncharacterized protein LOC129577678 n=1 Tax=Sitodiplosis mosellana TaxID=263140 RepID=UPI0024451A58|nr:uncharacterized protein LOC129577678 [Sitodiplosis mosellana]
MNGYEDLQRMRNELENLHEQVLCSKFDLKIEEQKTPFIRDMLKAEEIKQQNLAKSEQFFAECWKKMEETDEIMHQLDLTLGVSGYHQDIFCVVEEILRHRQKISDEREQGHRRRMAVLETELMRMPHAKAMNAQRKKLQQLEKELDELDRQVAAEQAEIDAITEDEQKWATTYESSIREVEMEMIKDEAEIAQITVEIGRIIGLSVETSAEQSIAQPTSQAVTEPSTVPNEIPLHLQKLDVVETTMNEFSDMTLSFTEVSTQAAQHFAPADQSAHVNVLNHGESGSSSLPTADSSQSVSNATRQSVITMVRTDRSDESKLVKTGENNAPLFLAPLAPAPHNRKESPFVQASPAKRCSFEIGESSLEPPRKTPCKPPRQSLQTKIGSIERSRIYRNEPGLNLVKRQYPTEQKLMIKPSSIQKIVITNSAQSPMGATPREVVLQLLVEHHENDGSGRSVQSSPFQPIKIPDRRPIIFNQAGSFPVIAGGRSVFKALTKFSSVKATANGLATAFGEGTLQMWKHDDNQQMDKPNERPGTSCSAERAKRKHGVKESNHSGGKICIEEFDMNIDAWKHYKLKSTDKPSEEPGTSGSAKSPKRQHDDEESNQSNGEGSFDGDLTRDTNECSWDMDLEQSDKVRCDHWGLE